MLVEKPTGKIRTAYDINNNPYLFEATGAEAKRFVDIMKADDEGRLVVLPRNVENIVYIVDRLGVLNGENQLSLFFNREDAEKALWGTNNDHRID